MKRKFLFVLLMSGVILSSMGVYAMDDEGLEPHFSIPGMKLLSGEHLKKIGDAWVNENGTIRIPEPKSDAPLPIALEDDKEKTLSAIDHSGFLAGVMHFKSKGDIIQQYPMNNIWRGAHHVFIVDNSGRAPTIDAFPFINEPRVP